MRVVLDTNIIVSAFIVALGAPTRIVAAWRAGRIEIIVSPALLREYQHSLSYPRVLRRTGHTLERVAVEVESIRRLAVVVEPLSVPTIVARDADDDEGIAAAVTGNARYIVTGDPDLLEIRRFGDIRIASPATFLEYLDGGGEDDLRS